MAERQRVTYEDVRKIGLALPRVEDSTSYGTPALKVKGKLMARLKEDGETLVVIIGFEERQKMLEADPRVFFITDHYLNYPSVLVRLPLVRRDVLRGLLKGAWERAAARAKRKR